MRAVLYLRVSSKEQLEGSSIETQERTCKSYAINNDYEIDKIFIEKGESAKTINRTELKNLLDYISVNHKKIDSIIVYKVDRLSRNVYDHSTLKVYFNRLSVKLLSATEHLEDTPIGRFVENSLANTAQLDNEVRSERCKGGMITAVMAGRYVWRAPLGYINVGGRGTANIKPDIPEKVELIKKIWELIDIGFSPEETRRELTKQGLRSRSGKPINKSYFYRMIKNKIYMGVIENFGLSIVGSFKPIVDATLFYRVQDKLKGKRKNYSIYKKDNADFPLRGLIRCPHCEKVLTASWSKGRSKKYAYYRCVSCKGVNLKRDEIESKFVAFIKQFNCKPELHEMIMKAIELNIEERNKNNKKKNSDIQRKILELRAQEKQIVDKNLKNVINDNIAKELLEENEREITRLTLLQGEYDEIKSDFAEVIEFSFSLLRDIGKIWSNVNLGIKKRFQKFLFPQGITYDGQKFRTAEIPLCINQISMMRFKEYGLVAPTGFEPVPLA